jgi:plastocyanin
VRRLAVGLTATAALLLAVPASPPLGAAADAGAAECTWQRHTKRVLKRVRRHGKVRRVVHRKRWWTCVPQAATPAAVPPAPAPPPPAEPEPEANRLSVKGAEYYFVLSRPSVKAGTVTIELNNRGEDPHNLNLRLEGDAGEPLQLPETPSQQRSVDSFDLPAGKYRLWCSLLEHEALGMATTLVVE